jgi:uncharacterized damage-inducible protein DinB
MIDDWLDTWRIHCRINLYVLDAVAPEVFELPKPVKGRNVPQMFAHIHDVRLMWLEAGRFAGGLDKLGRASPLDRPLLRASLEASGQAMEAMLRQALESGQRVSGFKPHTSAFLGYLVSHEAYHHGEIGIALREAGFPLDRKTAYGMWEWGAR